MPYRRLDHTRRLRRRFWPSDFERVLETADPNDEGAPG
jgi:hypothetical protein